MKKLFFLVLLGFQALLGADTATLIDCNQIFEQRKEELLKEFERIDEEQQALEALQTATQQIIEKKEAAIAKREADVNASLQQIQQRETAVKKMLEENQKLLKAISKAKDEKIAETYAKMKASKSAPIMEQLDTADAAAILFNLEPKIMGAVLGKMTPAVAAELTAILKKGPPFKKETKNLEVTQQGNAM